jgi:hypothetical protein
MHRGYRRMHHRPDGPGWVGRGHHGARHGHGPWHHGTICWERGYESYRAGPRGTPPTAEEERDSLRDQAEALRRYLGRIERRIAELEPSGA